MKKMEMCVLDLPYPLYLILLHCSIVTTTRNVHVLPPYPPPNRRPTAMDNPNDILKGTQHKETMATTTAFSNYKN